LFMARIAKKIRRLLTDDTADGLSRTKLVLVIMVILYRTSIKVITNTVTYPWSNKHQRSHYVWYMLLLNFHLKRSKNTCYLSLASHLWFLSSGSNVFTYTIMITENAGQRSSSSGFVLVKHSSIHDSHFRRFPELALSYTRFCVSAVVVTATIPFMVLKKGL
jgi:hypothetical protein